MVPHLITALTGPINELEQRLKINLPQHRVSIIKQVADLSYKIGRAHV